MMVIKDLTSGSVGKRLFIFMIPLIISNVFQQLYNTVDSLVIARLMGQSAFAAAGAAGPIMNAAIFILAGLCMGGAVIMAQKYGAHDEDGFKKAVFTFLVFGGGIALILSAVGTTFATFFLRVTRTPEDIMADARAYLVVIFLGMIFTFLYNMYAGILRSVGDSRAALFFLVISFAVHIALAILFVGLFGMGTAGAALATVVSQALSVLLCMIYQMKKYPHLTLKKRDCGIDLGLLKLTASYSGVAALQQSSLYIGKLLVQSAVNPLGSSVIAAYAAVSRLDDFIQAPSIGGAEGLTTFVAQNKGAGQKGRIKKAFNIGFVLLVTFSSTLALAAFLFSGPLLRIFLKDASDAAVAVGQRYINIIAPFYLLAGMGNAFQSFFRGMGRLNVSFIGTSIHITIRVVLSYVLVKQMMLGGVGLAVGVGWMVMIVFQSVMTARIRKTELK